MSASLNAFSPMNVSRKPRVLVTHWVHPEVLAHLETTCEVVANESRTSWPLGVPAHLSRAQDHRRGADRS